MRILQVGAFPFPSPQGSQLLLAGAALALHRAGHAVRIVCYGHGDRAAEANGALAGAHRSVFTRCREEHVPVVRVPAPPGYRRMRSGPDGVKPLLDVLLARAVFQTLERQGADIVHAHNHEALLACAVAVRSHSLRARARAAAGRGRLGGGRPNGGSTGGVRPRLVYGEHTSMAEELPSYFAASGATCTRAAVAAGRVLDAVVPRLSDGAVALSPRGLAALERCVPGPVALISPGVDPDDFRGVTPRRAGPGRWLVYAGTIDDFQRLDLLPRVLAAMPGWRLLVVTHGPKPEIPGAVCVGGPWREVRDWIAGADVAVVPRLQCLGFPMKLLNYAALGLRTVVASGSARGVPGEEIVRGDDVGAWRAGVLSAAGKPAADPEHVYADWGWDRHAAQLAALYDVTAGAAAP
ncbi:MAG: glycosyltransferase [Myxococcales bacterium]|nr:glycosyltransferase [Myxococcales bacterium]